jgi:hypothetical protein
VLRSNAQAQMSGSFTHLVREPRKGPTWTVLMIGGFVVPRSEGTEWRAVVPL